MLGVGLSIFCDEDVLLVARLYQFFSASAHPCTCLCSAPDAARNCLAQNGILTCLNRALNALVLHKISLLTSKDLN